MTTHSSSIDAADATPSGARDRKSSIRKQGSGESQRIRLLVVDDDEDFLDLVREFGRRQLIDISCARTSEQALHIAATERLDGILLDVWLGPTEASFQLAEDLMTRGVGGEIPIAFVSADTSLGRRVAAAQVGAHLFLPKPLTEARLADAAAQLAALKRSQQARVLILDDDPEFVSCAKRALEDANYRVTCLSEGSDVLPTLEVHDHDALILNLAMPAPDGRDLLRVLRTNPRWRNLPILIVTDCKSFEVRLDAIRAGCDDFLVKPVSEEELCARVQTRVRRQQIIRAQFERDALTGLPLRRTFAESLRSRVAEASRRDSPLAVALLDLDGFKEINDRYGHLAGDRVLASLGHLLMTDFRQEDLRARWGGEEFALAFPHQTAATIMPGMEDLLQDLQNVRFEDDEHGAVFTASFSAGLAEYPSDGTTAEALIQAADERLYEAKRRGRARIVGPERPARDSRGRH